MRHKNTQDVRNHFVAHELIRNASEGEDGEGHETKESGQSLLPLMMNRRCSPDRHFSRLPRVFSAGRVGGRGNRLLVAATACWSHRAASRDARHTRVALESGLTSRHVVVWCLKLRRIITEWTSVTKDAQKVADKSRRRTEWARETPQRPKAYCTRAGGVTREPRLVALVWCAHMKRLGVVPGQTAESRWSRIRSRREV
ncbi:unnamed protein product, partial [Pylaiella littoralis]